MTVRATRIHEQIRQFLDRAGSNIVTSTAYDTAWVAALIAPDSTVSNPAPRFPESLIWLREHQLPDGSWGAPWPHYHDRLLSTLRAVLTLHGWNRYGADQPAIDQGLAYIRCNADKLQDDPWETIGFELIFPALLAEARQRGLDLPYSAFGAVEQTRAAKLALAPLHLAYQRDMPLVVSLEGLGDSFVREHAGEVQEHGGAVGISPAATAYLLDRWPDNALAHRYLERMLREGSGDGGAATFFPIETFERGWALYLLGHALPMLGDDFPDSTQRLLAFLRSTCRPGGWATSIHHTMPEPDSTGITFTVLGRAGYNLDPELLYQYEAAEHFRCYPFERNPSVSTNIHVLDALHYCDPRTRGPRVAKVLSFLQSTRHADGYWFDKWHASPYYATGHAILAAHDWAPALVQPAITWLLTTQRIGGGWGYYTPTLEETAYAVLALHTWRAAGHTIPDGALARGIDYLAARFDPTFVDYPPLWIGKTLYVPVQVVQAAILAALLCGE